MLCPACLMGYTWECILGCKEKRIPIEETKEHGGQTKSRDKVKDLESTVRKRAAEMYPIKEGMLCEWTRLRYAGGGIIPIIGCSGNAATARHHGPDKNTLNNEMGNVHRVCSSCHNRYHAANDRYYPGDRPPGDVSWIPIGDLVPHDSITKVTDKELVENELKWRSNTALNQKEK